MGKTQRALTSLIGAIPAAFLAYLLVMVFLGSSDKLSTMLMIVIVATLICAAVVVVMPFALLIPSRNKADKDEPVAASRGAKDEDSGDELAVAEEEVDVEDGGDSAAEFDIGESDADIMADSDEEITGATSSVDEIETSDFEEDDDDEPPAPKKRKR